MGNTDDRFVKTYSQNHTTNGIEIWVDKETGVNYVWGFSHHPGGMTTGMTVLLDAEGKPVVTPQKKQ